MKILKIKTYLFSLLFSLNAVAGSELEIRYLRINQKLFDTISFPMYGVGVGYTWISDNNYGLRIDLAKSTETANNLYVENLFYTNKINAMYGFTLFYRWQLTQKWSTEIGVGITDYKSTWKVNDVKPSWSDGTDSDKSYHARVYYQIEPNVDMFFGYSDLYRKHKEDKGREETRAFYFGFTYKF